MTNRIFTVRNDSGTHENINAMQLMQIIVEDSWTEEELNAVIDLDVGQKFKLAFVSYDYEVERTK